MSLVVTEVLVRTAEHPLAAPFQTALRRVSVVESVYVELRCAGGVRGFGEAVPTLAITGESRAGIREVLAGPLRDTVLGADAADLAELSRRVAGAVVGNHAAKAAMDCALHDLVARAWDLSVGQLLGAGATSVATDVTVGVGGVAEVTEAARSRTAAGFTTLKLKLGSDPAGDAARVRAVRSAVGTEVELRLDANQGWTPRQAVEILGELHHDGIRVALVEQPVPAEDLAGMAFVTARSPVPVLADESVQVARDVIEIAERRAADAVNIKLMKCGGLRAGLELAATARAVGLDCLVGGMMESPLAVLAAAALAAVVAPAATHDLDAAWWLRTRSVLLDYRHGRLAVAPGPGFGPDPVLARLCGSEFSPAPAPGGTGPPEARESGGEQRRASSGPALG